MSNVKIVTFSTEGLYEGVDILANAVKTTLGPKGRNVIIQAPYGTPLITKDGVTVAREITLEDPIQDMGVQIVKQAAQRTSATAGDGTTSSIVIAQSLIQNARPLLENYSAIEIKRKFDELSSKSLKRLQDFSYQVVDEDIESIATISANNDAGIGKLIQEAYSFVGREGLVSVEDSSSEDTYVKTVEGASFKMALASSYFATDFVKNEATYQDPYILVTSKKLRTTNDLVPIMNKVASLARPLVIIADEIETQALAFLLTNKVRANFPVLALSPPAFGDRRSEILKDIAILTGAKLITTDQDRIEDVTLQDLGTCSRITSNKDETLLVGLTSSGSTEVANRIAKLMDESTKATDDWTKSKLLERISTLQGKVAILYIGAPTEAELKEKKDRIDDALRATKCAIQSGYCTGGGLTYYRLALSVIGIDPISTAFKSALTSPLLTILQNAGVDPSEVKVDPDTDMGFNALTNKTSNLLKDGVIDPTLVISEAIKNATSVASTLLLTSVTIHNKSQDFFQPSLPQ